MQAHTMQTTFQQRALAKPSSARASGRRQLRCTALFGRKSSTAVVEKKADKQQLNKAEEYEKKRGGMNKFLSSMDFAEVRSKSDAELLYEAKYGDRSTTGGKMTREQYRALRRKIGGTAKDFWKTSIDVQGKYTDKGYVSSSSTASGVPGLPFLVGIVVLMFATLGLVVAQTS